MQSLIGKTVAKKSTEISILKLVGHDELLWTVSNAKNVHDMDTMRTIHTVPCKIMDQLRIPRMTICSKQSSPGVSLQNIGVNWGKGSACQTAVLLD